MVKFRNGLVLYWQLWLTLAILGLITAKLNLRVLSCSRAPVPAGPGYDVGYLLYHPLVGPGVE